VIAATDDGLVRLDDGEALDPRPARFVDRAGRALLADGTLLDAERGEVARVPGASCFAATRDAVFHSPDEGASWARREVSVRGVRALGRA